MKVYRNRRLANILWPEVPPSSKVHFFKANVIELPKSLIFLHFGFFMSLTWYIGDV